MGSPAGDLFGLANRLPATGRAPVARPVAPAVPAAVPTLRLPAPRFISAQRHTTPATNSPADQAQGQGPGTSTHLDTSTLASGVGALRAILGPQGFRAFVQRAAYYSLGPPSALNAAAYGAGFIFDPVRYLYAQGARLIIPGPPVAPIRGLLTSGAEDLAANFLRLFQPSALEQQRNYVRLRNASLLARAIREGRVARDHPQVARESQRLGIDILALADGTLGAGEQSAGLVAALQQFVNQYAALGAFTGTASGGVMPGEQGDP